MNSQIEKYKRVQKIAKDVLEKIPCVLNADATEKSIAQKCVELLARNGIAKTWYYDCPALVLLGSRSCLSVSGRDYRPSEEKVGGENLITIDLSPLDGEIWGDLARSFVFEKGGVKKIGEIANAEFREGFEAEKILHEKFRRVAKPLMTFDEIFDKMNSEIERLGFENLDFNKNVGHTIETRRENRLYFEAGNRRMLTAETLFTFEPHIKKRDGKWGFKFENIYYFDGEKVAEL